MEGGVGGKCEGGELRELVLEESVREVVLEVIVREVVLEVSVRAISC